MPRDYSAERISGWCAVACLVISALLLGNPTFSNASLPVDGITDPVIAIQAARSVKDVDYVLGESPSPDREVMRVKERIGIGFTVAYTGLFLSLSVLLSRSGAVGRILAPAAAVTSLAAGGFNVASNLAVLRLLNAHLYEITAPMIGAIRSAAFVSWAGAAITLLLLSVYCFRNPAILARLTGLLFVVTALLQLLGLREGALLVLASAPAGLALVMIAMLMLVLPRVRKVQRP